LADLGLRSGLMTPEEMKTRTRAFALRVITVSSINTPRSSKQASASGRFNNSAFRNPNSEIV